MADREFDRQRFKQLVHYVIWKAGKRDWFGATKLYKVLWFADARQYVLHGQSITGEVYIRDEFGPRPRDAMTVRSALERGGAIQISKEGNLTRFVALREPDVSEFTREELRAVDYWIDHIDRDHTAGTISEESHDVAWEIAKQGEELPFYALKVARFEIPTGDDLERLKRKAEELGL